jgi:hypothetical protein
MNLGITNVSDPADGLVFSRLFPCSFQEVLEIGCRALLTFVELVLGIQEQVVSSNTLKRPPSSVLAVARMALYWYHLLHSLRSQKPGRVGGSKYSKSFAFTVQEGKLALHFAGPIAIDIQLKLC